VTPTLLGLLGGVVRGAVAWLLGWVLTLAAAVAGILGGPGIAGSAVTYVRTHAVPPSASVGVLIPVLAVGITDLRAGRNTRTGVTGRIRSSVQSVRGTERNRAGTAAVAGGLLAVGYAAVGLVVALVLGGPTASALVGSLVYGIAIGVPTAVVGAFY
jgi:hypothetical protein